MASTMQEFLHKALNEAQLKNGKWKLTFSVQINSKEGGREAGRSMENKIEKALKKIGLDVDVVRYKATFEGK